MSDRAKIALLIDTSTSWGAGLIEGIAEFAEEKANWHCFLGPRGKYDSTMLPDAWSGDGVIARVTSQRLADQLIASRIPAVDVSWYRYGDGQIPLCTCNERTIADLAAEHFIERGFRQFAYCPSTSRTNYHDRLGEAFVESLRRQMFHCHVFKATAQLNQHFASPEELAQMVAWLKSLPKPIGLLAFDSIQARQTLEACQLAQLDVPHNVAVLGGEHDYLSCTISNPQLSSVDQSPQRVGRAAAELLAKLMAGESPPVAPILLPAERVITRQSTDTVAIDDELLALAVDYIKRNSASRIQVTDILDVVPICRRALEKGFRKRLGRSPSQEIRRVRLDHAIQLLCDTSWPMPRIASACGFERPELLASAFRRELNTTPTAFRKQHRRDQQSQPLS